MRVFVVMLLCSWLWLAVFEKFTNLCWHFKTLFNNFPVCLLLTLTLECIRNLCVDLCYAIHCWMELTFWYWYCRSWGQDDIVTVWSESFTVSSDLVSQCLSLSCNWYDCAVYSLHSQWYCIYRQFHLNFFIIVHHPILLLVLHLWHLFTPWQYVYMYIVSCQL